MKVELKEKNEFVELNINVTKSINELCGLNNAVIESIPGLELGYVDFIL